jgi:hypothetical protein
MPEGASEKKKKKKKKSSQEEGLGVLCAEAQADGVPCHELGRDCDVCEMAAPGPEEAASKPPAR